ncbi:MAG: YjbH domain-containing protein [Armatimonadetes bacterium]|nr:YjbH domain-containing protein [Armatimonadota bacterium]
MRFTLTVALLPVLLALVPPRAAAAPSFLGPTGHILTPSADTLESRHYALSLHHQPYWNLITANYSPFDRLEVGVSFVDPTEPGEYQTHAGLNAKLLLVREALATPAIAVGVFDAFDWVAEGPYGQRIYVVASKDLKAPLARPVRLSAGIGTRQLKRGFGAVSVPLTSFLTGMVEYDGATFNLNARVKLPRGFLLDVAAVDWGLGVGATFEARW